ncbi:MAG TPA: Calx-beta domain-containing protein [Pyrinomonadaceae bacterium]
MASNYTFATATNASLTDMSTGTTQLLAGNIDDTASALTNIGFDFFFQGARFTQFSINENGVLRLGATAQTSTPYKPLAQANIPIITAYGADQRTHTGDGKVHFKVIGSAPNRTLVVEWLNNQANFNTGGTADLTYQVRLYERTGVIESVYGSMTMSTAGAADANSRDPHIGFSSSNLAGTVGSVTAPQSGAPAPTFNGASATPVANLYTAGAITVLTSAAQGSRRIFSYTPPVPTAPTGLTFSGVTAIGMTLNWTDSADETIYAVYRSLDGTNYTFDGTAAQNAVSYTASGLNPSTNYFWQVNAVSEGALSSALAGSQTTAAAGNITSAASGNWSNTATWSGGAVPTAGDNVTIASGHTVTIDSSNALNVTVQSGAILQFEQTTARTLTVGQSVTIDSGGTFQSNPAGTVTTHVLSVGANLTNNGTLDFSTNGNTAGAGITFTGASDASFTLGGSSTTDFKQTSGVTLNKGTNNTPVLTFTPGGTITVLGANTVGFLTITNGTFKVSGANAFSNPVFNAAAYAIPAAGGFWMNNANATVVGLNGSPTVTGLFRMTLGTFNIGTATGNSMGFAAGANINVEGGAINSTGRFGVAASANSITYNQSGGTITVCTIGNASTTLASFDLGTGVGTTNITGGTIVVQLANTGGSGPRDFRNQSGLTGTTTVTGGTVQLGNAASGAAKAFTIAGVLPNLVIDNTSAGHSATFNTPAVFNNITRNITINTGTTLNIGNNVFLMNGATLTNNGTLTANGASSNFVWFLTTSPQSYTGSGTVTSPMTNFAMQADMGLTIDQASPNIVCTAIRLFSGSVTGSNKLTLGTGGASTGVVQIGNTTTPTAAGTFDVPLTFNLGTGGETISYLRTTTSRTTGGEVNPTRTLTSMTYDDNDLTHTVTIAGGDLTLSSTATALTMTNGRIITGSNNLILSSGTATVTRTNGYVDGNFRKAYSASASKVFEVGTANGYSPVTANVTAGAPGNLTVKAVQGPQPNLSGANALQRYWTLTGAGLTADLTFQYRPTDPVGNEAAYNVFRYNGTFTNLGGVINTGADTAAVTGVTSLNGDWTAAEPGSDALRSMSISDVSTVETDSGNHLVSFTVTLSSTSALTASASWSTTPGTAQTPSDYAASAGTVSFSPGATMQTIMVPVNGDVFDEANENFFVNLTSPGNSTISDATGVCTIIDDDINSGDFDGDGINDSSVFRPVADNPGEAKWYVLNSADQSVTEQQFGASTDIPVAGDFDGDGKKDIAVFRGNDDGMGGGAFYVSNGSPQDFDKYVWGANGDVPVIGDYDGDLKSDVAVFRPSDGNWYIRRSSDEQLLVQQWGLATDRLVPADYDADGKTDLAVFRNDDPSPGSGTWYILRSSDAGWIVQQWGSTTDKLVPADYDVDGKADIAVWRPSDGYWYILRSSNNVLQATQWGTSGDVPVAGDYDGDSKADTAVWRPSDGKFYILKSSDNTYIGPAWGTNGDVPVASKYVPVQ